MKNRIRYRNLVVSAEDLPKMNKIMRLLSELAPSDAFISIDFHKAETGYRGTLKLASSMHSFSEQANHQNLVPLMHTLSDLSMVHIKQWRQDRFVEKDEKLIS
jgi:hypothetical protein